MGGFGALLSGAAGGINQEYSERREDLLTQAKRDFAVKLENTRRENAQTDRIEMEDIRRTNAKADRDQAATDIMNPETPTGGLAARNAAALSASQSAEWSREDKNKKLDRESEERQAGMKAGKGKNSDNIKALTKEIDTSLDLMTSDSVDEATRQTAKAKYARAMTEYRSLTGLSPDAKPAPTQAALAKLKDGKGTAADFAGFNKAFGLPEGSAQKLYSEGKPVAAPPPPPAKERPPSIYEQRANKETGGQRTDGPLTSYFKNRQADPVKTANDTIDLIAARQGDGESIRIFLPTLQRYIDDETLPKEVREAARQIFMQ